MGSLKNHTSIRHLSILKRDRDIYGVIHKFEVINGARKYRISHYGFNQFIIQWTKNNSRYFCEGRKIFNTLPEAEGFIFTSECP